ncbi:alkaline phosphatase family protein [Bradyrhizobium sp. BR 1432]|uniref:alkaline phosphatase family protein n=1 Tax=Bradyrhizobium sp. BR 1432 TaxID=3447966 RepID=UPI003EE74937
MTPDTAQHFHGYDSQSAIWSIRTCRYDDRQPMNELERKGRLGEYAIAVASDHGHGAVELAIHPDAILGDMIWMTEGATLHVAVASDEERKKAVRLLEPVRCEALERGPHTSRHPELNRDIRCPSSSSL